jgi:hypothetical protein
LVKSEGTGSILKSAQLIPRMDILILRDSRKLHYPPQFVSGAVTLL